jgi:hypothetical protein
MLQLVLFRLLHSGRPGGESPQPLPPAGINYNVFVVRGVEYPDRNLSGRRARLVRAVLVALLLICFGGLQTASAITVHSHHHEGGGHSCAVCHAAHLPAAQALHAVELTAPVVTEWRHSREEALAPAGQSPVLNFSRAPPA